MLKIIFAGTPEFALPALELLQASSHQLVAVYTQPDRPAGRGRRPQASPIKSFALSHQLPVYQPVSFKEPGALQALGALEADLMVVAAYGLLLPAAVLETPKFGCVNIHASLLPRWRGASPIQQAILAGDRESGVTLMKMDQGLDTGDMIASRSLAIDPGWTSAALHDRLAPLGGELLMEALDDFESSLEGARAQDEGLARYAPRLTKQQAQIDWSKPSEILVREILAFNPWPVSFTRWRDSNLRIWTANSSERFEAAEPGKVVAHDRGGLFVSCLESVLQVTELQFPGKSRCDAAQALNARNLSGCSLG